jgi:hypothetical protein
VRWILVRVTRFGPTALAKRQAAVHLIVLLPLFGIAVAVLPSIAGLFTLAVATLVAYLTTRPFRRPVSVSPELQVHAYDRIGIGHQLLAARAGVRVTIGLHERLFVPIVFPASGRSLTLWSLAERGESEAERWIGRLFAGTSVMFDEELHF